MQRVIDNDSYAASLDMYMSEARGDVWTIETKDRDMREIELLAPFMRNAGKKVCVGAVSHRRLQVEQPNEVADTIRLALKYVPAERLIVSTDCGFGRQGCNREIAFFKTTSIAQGCNLVRAELGLPKPLSARRPQPNRYRFGQAGVSVDDFTCPKRLRHEAPSSQPPGDHEAPHRRPYS
jgi:5-methyltetrahydropteroyltriglutamate--homocysteine methyltransferase